MELRTKVRQRLAMTRERVEVLGIFTVSSFLELNDIDSRSCNEKGLSIASQNQYPTCENSTSNTSSSCFFSIFSKSHPKRCASRSLFANIHSLIHQILAHVSCHLFPPLRHALLID